MTILETTRAVALLLAASWAIGGAVGCSFVIESQDRQCESDKDCNGFADAMCDVAGGVCVPRATASTSSTGAGGGGAGGGGAECIGPDGCFSCPPSAQAEFLNACTDSACIPYDNGPLADLLLEGGTVPPVP